MTDDGRISDVEAWHAVRVKGKANDRELIPELVLELCRRLAEDVGVDPYPSPTAPPKPADA